MASPACPHCRQTLEPCHHAGCLRCPDCRGLFAPASAVRAAFLTGAESLANVPATAPAETPQQPPIAAAIACPACGAGMTPMRLADTLFHRCAGCEGLWFDAGHELPRDAAATRRSPAAILLYTLSLPERTLRSTAGVAGGVVKELADRIVPKAFQSSSTYTMLVNNSLRFLVEDMGGVAGKPDQSNPAIDNYVARKTVGNFLELAGLATLHVSPLVVLAVVSDLAYGSKAYLKELSDELRKEGLIDADSTISSVDDFMEAVGHASGNTATLFDTPPLSLADLRASIDTIRKAVGTIDAKKALPQNEVRRLWQEMREVADREGTGLLQVSSAITLHAMDKMAHVGRATLTGVRLAGSLVGRHVLAHYADALADIRRQGFYATVNEVATPYIAAVWANFSNDRPSITEDVLSGRLPARVWRWLRSRFRRKRTEAASGEWPV